MEGLFLKRKDRFICIVELKKGIFMKVVDLRLNNFVSLLLRRQLGENVNRNYFHYSWSNTQYEPLQEFVSVTDKRAITR